MQIPERMRVPKPERPYDKALEEELIRYSIELSKLLNSGLKFSDNFNMHIKSVTTDAVVGTETAVTHNLKRIPSDFLVGSQDKAGTIYKGSSAWTATTIYVRGSVASITANLYIF
jgi:hypothetical protein